MGEVGRGSEKRGSKGYREKERKREIWLPSSTGFFFFNLSTVLLSQNTGSEGSSSTENE